MLTSSSYGKAYLAEGWATQFVQAILQQYIVVFIGYSADDPPIQYLLEALRKTPGLLHGVAAFFWLESLVRETERRRLLFDMDMAILELRNSQGDTAPAVSLTGCYHNLLRMWAEV